MLGGLSHASGHAHGASAGGPDPGIAAALAAVEARQLRLQASGVGDHVPVEVALELRDLEARRRRLQAALLGG